MKGYQLIETDFTAKLNNVYNSIKDIDVACLVWVVEFLKQDTEIKALPIEIDVIQSAVFKQNN